MSLDWLPLMIGCICIGLGLAQLWLGREIGAIRDKLLVALAIYGGPLAMGTEEKYGKVLRFAAKVAEGLGILSLVLGTVCIVLELTA